MVVWRPGPCCSSVHVEQGVLSAELLVVLVVVLTRIYSMRYPEVVVVVLPWSDVSVLWKISSLRGKKNWVQPLLQERLKSLFGKLLTMQG